MQTVQLQVQWVLDTAEICCPDFLDAKIVQQQDVQGVLACRSPEGVQEILNEERQVFRSTCPAAAVESLLLLTDPQAHLSVGQVDQPVLPLQLRPLGHSETAGIY